ncbi:hypothetical protein Taro_002514 [Colocasia esculenta]|uniref:Uncharacterized protein n=1 Tax=Colocasia esculenta TaxID=4460 RepID=A0A843TL48_COLES|nr:hypothetical protein [Colocasia esculenta]
MRKQGSRRRPLQALPPTETLELGVAGLSLSPHLKLLLTFFRTDPSVRPVDEWQLRRALLGFLREPLALSVPEEDLLVHKRPDLHKRKREEPVASGTLFVRDLGFLKKNDDKYKGSVVGGQGSEEGEDVEGLRKKFLEWRDGFVGRLDGIELNLEGVKFRLGVEMPPSEDFDRLKKSWEDFYANQSSANRKQQLKIFDRSVEISWGKGILLGGSSIDRTRLWSLACLPDGLQSRGNLNVACNDDPSKKEENKGDILSGLHCKVWVQFENYDDFCTATRVLCGRSMQKEGSRLKADYEVSWDRDGFFRCIQQRISKSHVEVGSQTHTRPPVGQLRRETPRLQSEVTRVIPDVSHRKRFRE